MYTVLVRAKPSKAELFSDSKESLSYGAAI